MKRQQKIQKLEMLGVKIHNARDLPTKELDRKMKFATTDPTQVSPPYRPLPPICTIK